MIRLDKWLWAARQYKTRSIASDAIKNGKVRVNDIRVKASKTVAIGDKISINKGQGHETIVEVLRLSDKRASYAIASQLYKETAESLEKAKLRKAAQLSGLISTASPKKPDKKQRRQLLALRKGS
jgi:ribosome-associated heat shock protein Hsp15